MTDKVVIFNPRPRLNDRSPSIPVWINAEVYRQLGPIAARQRMTVQGLVNRVCEGVIECTPQADEVPVA